MFVPALLVATLLIEPVLYDDDRVAMALGGAFFAAALAVLATRAPAGPPATAALPGDVRTGHRSARRPGVGGGVPSRAGGRTHRARAQPGLHHRPPGPRQPGVPGVRRDGQVGERSRITRELHDIVGYALTNIIVMIDAAKARAREEPESLDSLLDDARAQSERALNDTRQILHLLRSVEQFERKGIGAIFQLTRAFQDAMRLSVELHVGNLPPTLGPRIDSVLFRHGNASRVRITMWQAAEEIRVGVWDNGNGLPADETVQDGIGMSGMRERFAELGGTIRARRATCGVTGSCRSRPPATSSFRAHWRWPRSPGHRARNGTIAR